MSHTDLQALHFELLRRAWGRRGEAIIAALEERRGAWAAVIGAYLAAGGGELVPLRELHHGTWGIDTLYVLSVGDAETKARARAQLEPLAEAWGAEFTWQDAADPGDRSVQQALGTADPSLAVARFWWDDPPR